MPNIMAARWSWVDADDQYEGKRSHSDASVAS
jgi:hypothetical protein